MRIVFEHMREKLQNLVVEASEKLPGLSSRNRDTDQYRIGTYLSTSFSHSCPAHNVTR